MSHGARGGRAPQSNCMAMAEFHFKPRISSAFFPDHLREPGTFAVSGQVHNFFWSDLPGPGRTRVLAGASERFAPAAFRGDILVAPSPKQPSSSVRSGIPASPNQTPADLPREFKVPVAARSVPECASPLELLQEDNRATLISGLNPGPPRRRLDFWLFKRWSSQSGRGLPHSRTLSRGAVSAIAPDVPQCHRRLKFGAWCLDFVSIVGTCLTLALSTINFPQSTTLQIGNCATLPPNRPSSPADKTPPFRHLDSIGRPPAIEGDRHS
jgi:hypothetical protein